METHSCLYQFSAFFGEQLSQLITIHITIVFGLWRIYREKCGDTVSIFEKNRYLSSEQLFGFNIKSTELSWAIGHTTRKILRRDLLGLSGALIMVRFLRFATTRLYQTIP